MAKSKAVAVKTVTKPAAKATKAAKTTKKG